MATKTQHEPEAPPIPTTRTTLAAWRCMECNVCTSGHIDPYDFKPRRCQGIPKSQIHGYGHICGGAMVQVYREDA